MVAVEELFTINANPADSIAQLGGGNLAKGLSLLSKVSNAIKRPWSNIGLMAAQDTVGADLIFSVSFDLKFDFLMTGYLYENSVGTATGYLTDIKGNGYPMANIGYGIETGSSANILINEIAQFDGVDWIMLFPEGSTLTFEGAGCLENDVVKIIPFGWNMNMFRAG